MPKFIGCKLFAGFGTGSGLSCIWTITAISFERCKAISSPLSSSRSFTNKKVWTSLMTLRLWWRLGWLNLGPPTQWTLVQLFLSTILGFNLKFVSHSGLFKGFQLEFKCRAQKFMASNDICTKLEPSNCLVNS